MLISCRFSVIGLYLLLLTHIAHTFVLLTANMDDVKKLARKFVSENLAEKIAEFITAATQQMASNVSEENDINPDVSHQVSEENNMYNVGRQGSDSAAQDSIKSKEEINSEKQEDDNIHSNSDLNESNKDQQQNRKTETEKHRIGKVNLLRQEKSKRYSVELKSLEPNTVTRHSYSTQEPDKNKSKISEEDEKYNKDDKYVDDNFVTTQSTTSFNAAENKSVKKKIKGRPYRLLAHVDTIEDNEVPPVEINKPFDDFSENERFDQIQQELTTRKEMYEFDQYGNKNYPKSAFLATSGPIVLRKINDKGPDNWWEKEMPG